MGVSAQQILDLGLVDQVVPEPLGGAHRDYNLMMNNLRRVLSDNLAEIQSYSPSKLLELRYQRLMSYGLTG